MQFVKKPVVIEARQFTAQTDLSLLLQWVLDHGGTAKISMTTRNHNSEHPYGFDYPTIAINTLEGQMLASVGDWIIKGVQGEFYPCKPDVFEATYSPVPANHMERFNLERDELGARIKKLQAFMWENPIFPTLAPEERYSLISSTKQCKITTTPCLLASSLHKKRSVPTRMQNDCSY